MASSTADREIVITRTVAAPRELVWKALTRPEHLAKWWGPNGFTITTHEMSVKPGGSWRFTMHGPDGTEFPNKITFHEVREPERLAYDHGDFEKVHFQASITLAARKGGTEVTLRSVFPTREARDFVIEKVGAIEGGKQTLARLDEHVSRGDAPAKPRKMTIGPYREREILITREFAAPRSLVWEAYTVPTHIVKWLGVHAGWRFATCDVDLRVGGKYRWVWRGPDGTEMGMGGEYREVKPVERLVATEKFDQAWYPGEAVNTLTLRESDGITILAIVTRYESTEARDAVLKSPMEHGLRAGFDALESLLAGEDVAAVDPTDVELVITRELAAPASAVFEAWSRPEHVKKWFGPNGWPVTLCEMDFRKGGRFRMQMTGPGGQKNTPFGGEYREIVPGKKIVFDNGFESPGAERMVVTVTFEEKDGRTTMTHRTVFESAAMKKAYLAAGIVEGLHSGFDQLVDVVAALR